MDRIQSQIIEFMLCPASRNCDSVSPSTKVSKNLVTNVLLIMQGKLEHDEHDEAPFWSKTTVKPPFEGRAVIFRNGILAIDRLVEDMTTSRRISSDEILYSHDPDYFCLSALPYDFDPDAQCPTILKLLEETFDGDQDRVDLVQEWFGYNLTPNMRRREYMVFSGDAATGKTTVAYLAEKMLGSENVSKVPLEVFCEDFQLMATYGKLANIAGEVEISGKSEPRLKQYTGGDGLTLNRKYKDSITFFPTAKLTFVTNNLPRIRDKSEGVWDRMMILPFNRVIPAEEKRDRSFWEELSQELPGLFLWACHGLARLNRKRAFTYPEASRVALKIHRAESDSARLFLIDNFEPAPESNRDNYIVSKLVYGHYQQWSEENGYKPVNSGNFGKTLFKVFPNVSRVRVRTGQGRPWAYRGIVNVTDNAD